MDIIPRMKQWVCTTSQNMGNWTSKEAVAQELEAVPIEPVPVFKRDIPLELLNEVLQDKQELVAVGFDVLQVSRYKMVFVTHE